MIDLGLELENEGTGDVGLSLDQVISREVLAELKFKKLGLWHRLFMRAYLRTVRGSTIYHRGNCTFRLFSGKVIIFPTVDDPDPSVFVATSLYVFTRLDRIYMVLGQILTPHEISAASIAQEIRRNCTKRVGMQTHRDERFDVWEDDESTVLLEISKNLKNVHVYWRLK